MSPKVDISSPKVDLLLSSDNKNDYKNLLKNKNDLPFVFFECSQSKDEVLMTSINNFFKKKKNLKDFLKIYNKESKISLRILDWFVTNYAKKNNIILTNTLDKKNPKNFFVYLEYKAQLKSYSKLFFDPFCRRERIIFKYNDNDQIITTVGQLNFFRWCIENNIIKYVQENINDIEFDMNNTIKLHYKEKKDNPNIKNKRTQLSISASKKVNKHNVKIVVDFN